MIVTWPFFRLAIGQIRSGPGTPSSGVLWPDLLVDLHCTDIERTLALSTS